MLLRDFSSKALPLFKSPVSVQDESSSNVGFISVGPNPAVDHVVVRVRIESTASATVTVSDMRGRELRTSQIDSWTGVGTVDLGGLSSGTYVLTLKADRATTHTFVNINR